ncbi:tetratricopeptide repeat protein [Acrasis kona]|uniref:Tetratricopeptide repeat protein n=1 Tax=Acrasis kona TaxID=1008807 RepID=A0AAW2YIP1_9EUKA
MWFLKCRALTAKNWIDDTEMEDEGVAELLLDDHSVASAPRPGTSLKKPFNAESGRTTANPGIRPTTRDGRPVTGFARPGTGSARPTTGSQSVESAFSGSRPGTSRPVTQSGRFVRLGTASMRTEEGGPFIVADSLDLKKYAQRPALAKALCDYLLYFDHNAKKALELAAFAIRRNWWWKARLGKCYYKLGLYRDAEKQFKSSLKDQDMITTYLELGKVYIKLDQPNAAIEYYEKGCHQHPGDTHLILGIARIHDQLNDMEKSLLYYEKILDLNSSNIEGISCLAGNYFYEDQPELALRLYRRLIQMGVNNTELWNNLALCCFYSSQYDMCLNCFERALALADDNNMADVWYNIGQVAIGIGDLGLAYHAFKVAISVDGNHPANSTKESFNNLGVLELRQGHLDESKNNFDAAISLGPYLHEPVFNSALLSYKMGNHQDSYNQLQKVLEIYPQHTDSAELLTKLRKHFS